MVRLIRAVLGGLCYRRIGEKMSMVYTTSSARALIPLPLTHPFLGPSLLCALTQLGSHVNIEPLCYHPQQTVKIHWTMVVTPRLFLSVPNNPSADWHSQHAFHHSFIFLPHNSFFPSYHSLNAYTLRSLWWVLWLRVLLVRNQYANICDDC